jgi:hypothetical protein
MRRAAAHQAKSPEGQEGKAVQRPLMLAVAIIREIKKPAIGRFLPADRVARTG